VQYLIDVGAVTAVHDLSDGGLLVALTEMALAGNGTGALLTSQPAGITITRWLFGEDQGRFLASTTDSAALLEQADRAGVVARVVGKTKKSGVGVDQIFAIAIADLRAAHDSFFREWMEG
jgi:phosphoribosylformylglycinamidine synthase